MDQQALHQQIDFNEAWDSPKNLAISNMRVHGYGCPSDPNGMSTNTSYMLVTGPGTMFEGSKTVNLGGVVDGTSNTIMVVEVEGLSVNWMDPQDIDIEKFVASTGGPGGVGAKHPRGYNAAFADGSVRFMSDSVDQVTKRSVATRAGGEQVRLP